MTGIHISLLGPLQIIAGNTSVTGFRSDKVRGLLAYLAMEAGRPHRRDALAGLFWPELSEQKAHDNLRLALHRLRAALAAHAADLEMLLQITPKTIQFNLAACCCLDVAEFNRLLAECHAHAHPAIDRCPACAARLAQASGLYQGELLQGFYLESAAFDDWMLAERERLRCQALEALYHLAAYWELRGDYSQALDCARRQLEIDPWREEAHRQVMRALAASGQRSAARAQYERCLQVLQNELGVEPEAETQAIYAQIATGQFRPAARQQSISGLRHEAESDPGPGALPVPDTPFIGRMDELAQIEAWLCDPATRLLTLTGPGGAGKSRLAIEAARRQSSLVGGGVCFVALAGIPGGGTPAGGDRPAGGDGPAGGDKPAGGLAASHLLAELAGALQISFSGRGEPWEQLLHALADQEMLLVLDNFEHLMHLAPWLAELLAQTARVQLLVTSRQRLGLDGERVLEVSGLDFPSHEPAQALGDDGEPYSAVALFLESAARTGANLGDAEGRLAGVARICRLVEGLPLGLELAAAWLRVFSLEQVAQEIENDLTQLAAARPDLPDRHHSLQAVCDTSWKLLSESQQTVLCRLAIFRGGFTPQAARQAAGAAPASLVELAERSLLHRQRDGRLMIHEYLRQYAEQRLDELPGERQATQAQHAAYYQAYLAGRSQPVEAALRRGERPEEELLQIDQEIDNLWLAQHWLLSPAATGSSIQPDPAAAAQFVDGLGRYYALRGQPQEEAQLYLLGLAWLDRTQPPCATDSLLRARWQALLGQALLGQGQVEQSREQLRQALEGLGYRWPSSSARLGLGLAWLGLSALVLVGGGSWRSHLSAGRVETMYLAAHIFEQLAEISYFSNQRLHSLYGMLSVMRLAATSTPTPELARTYANLCIGTGMLGRKRLAQTFYRRGRALANELGDASTLAYVSCLTGVYDISQGNWEPARQALAQAAEIYAHLGYQRQWGECMMPQVVIAFAQGQVGQALALADQIITAAARSGNLIQQAWGLSAYAYTNFMAGDLAAALPGFQTSLGLHQQAAYLPGITTAYGYIGLTHFYQQDYLRARQAAGAAAEYIARSTHTLFINSEGYAAAAETFLGLSHLAAQAGLDEERQALARQAGRVIEALAAQSRGAPAAQPSYWLQRGRYAWLQQAPHKARQYLRRSLAVANCYGRLYDQGRAHLELGRCLPPGDPLRQEHLQQAIVFLERAGLTLYLRQAQQERARLPAE